MTGVMTMTSESRRYFQTPSGYVHADESEAEVGTSLDLGYTEVQVVPLDAIVVHGVLPEVKVREAGYVTDTKGIVTAPLDGRVAPEALVENALAYLALAKYLREHPPIDEEQVQAIADLLDSDAGEDAISDSNRTVARFLVQHGARVEAKS